MNESHQHHSYVPKSTDMMFVTLQAFGLAEFFHRINPAKADLEIFIEDIGAAFRVSVNVSIEEMKNRIIEFGLPNILPALIPTDKLVAAEEGKKPKYDSVLSRYLPDNFQGQTVFYARKTQTPEKENPFKHYLSRDNPLFPLWGYLCNFNSRAVTQRAYPLCIHAWHAHTLDMVTAQGLFETIAQLYDGTSTKTSSEIVWATSVKPKNYHGFEQFSWHKKGSKVSSLSVLSPTTVKGYQSPHARAGILEQNQPVFWLEFYFALVGFLCVAMPFEVEEEGIVLVYPQIQSLQYLHFRAFMESYRANDNYQHLLRKSMHYSLERTELLAGLLFFDSLQLYLIEEKSTKSLPLLDTAFSYYKHLGRSHTPFGNNLLDQANIRNFGLNLKVWLRMIDAIPNEDRLQLSCLNGAIRSNDFGKWLEFFCLYNPQYNLTKLSVEATKTILLQANQGVSMNRKPTSYADLFNNQGFMRIAEAINTCTERAAYLKSIGRETNLKIWHNLDQRLLEHADDASRFIPDIAQFILDYQKEMSRIRGNNKQKDYMQIVSLDALQDLYALIDKFGSLVVAYSLVAAGYSSHLPPKEDSAESEFEAEEE